MNIELTEHNDESLQEALYEALVPPEVLVRNIADAIVGSLSTRTDLTTRVVSKVLRRLVTFQLRGLSPKELASLRRRVDALEVLQ